MISAPVIILAAVVNCAAIADPDQRAYCQAKQADVSGYCAHIANFDLRQSCYAEFELNASRCMTISDGSQREACKLRGIHNQ